MTTPIIWKTNITVLIFIVIALLPASAEVSSNESEFGLCRVSSMIDEFTDEVNYHILGCGDWDSLMFACFPSTDGVNWTTALFIAGQQFEENTNVNVRIRFDKLDPYSRIWHTDHANRAITFDISDALGLLEDLSGSNSVILIAIDREIRRIDLSYVNIQQAVEETMRRCYPTNGTKELEPT